jgi:phospholipase/carboxylesterase
MLDSIQSGRSDHGRPGPTVVLCHGFGADAGDLAPLAEELGAGGEIRWLFPQAPYQFQMSWAAGRAWFPRDPAGIESFLSGENLGSLGNFDPPSLGTASVELIEFMDQMECDPAQTVVGGFSQGAMVAADAVLRIAHLPAGLLLFSGSIIAADRWRAAAADRADEFRSLRIAQYHGTDDPVLPYESGRSLAAVFESAGAAVEFTSFSGGHGIPGGVFPSVTRQLREMLGVY